MLFIKGDKGKGRLIESILTDDREDIVISIGEPELVIANYKIDEMDFNSISILKSLIISTISEECRYIIIYTNMNEQEIQPYIKTFEDLEIKLKNMIYNCIIMYK